MEKHEKVRGTISKLQQEGYRLNPKKCEFFKKEFERVAHKVDEQGIRPLKDKFEAITKINIPNNEKKLKSILEALQCLA